MLRSLDPRCRCAGFACALLAFLPAIAGAASIDADRLKLISPPMKEFVDNGSISGAVYLVAYGGHVAALDGVGFSDITASPCAPTQSCRSCRRLRLSLA